MKTIYYNRGEFIDFVQKCRDKKPFIVFREYKTWSTSAPIRRPFISLLLSFWDHCLRKYIKWPHARIYRATAYRTANNLDDGYYGHIEKCPMYGETQELTLYHSEEDNKWFAGLRDFVYERFDGHMQEQRENKTAKKDRNNIIYMREFKKILFDYDKKFFLDNSSIDEL
jgi:hypothetical protein